MIIKIYGFILKFVRFFFANSGRFFPFRQIGTLLYSLAEFISCRYLIHKIPETKTIYRITNYHDGWFQPGLSDIDLIAVFKDTDTEAELVLIDKINKTRDFLSKIFPFVWIGGTPFFEKDFKFWYKVNTNYIHHRQRYLEMKLVYGPEIRPAAIPIQKTKMSGYSLRFFYEEMLVNIYYNLLWGKSSYRIFYKFFQIYAQAGYTIEKAEAAPSLESPAMQSWLIRAGVEQPFLVKIINLKQKRFYCQDPSFNSDAIYNLIKITEYLTTLYQQKQPDQNKIAPLEIKIIEKERRPRPPAEAVAFTKALSKNHLRSVILTQYIISPEPVSFSLCLVSQARTSLDLKRQVRDFLDNLPYLKDLLTDIKKQHRGLLIFSRSIFPLILTEKILDFDTFINIDYLYEGLNINSNQVVLYGAPINIAVSPQSLETAPLSTVHLTFGQANKLIFKAVALALLRNEILSQNKYFDPTKSLSELYELVFQEKKPTDFEIFYLKIRNLAKSYYDQINFEKNKIYSDNN